MALPTQGSIRSLGPKPVSNLSDSSDDTVPPTTAMGIGVAACADHIMHRPAKRIYPILVEAIVNECCHGAKLWKAPPHPVSGGEVGTVQSAGFARIKPLGPVTGAPEV